jgi:hypothetical protein
MSETTASRWVRLQDGERFVRDLWSGFDGRQRREILVTALLSGKVSMRARCATKPRHADGRPMLPNLEREGSLGTTGPLPGIESFLRLDQRLVTWDIPAGRIVISPVWDDKWFWGGFNWEPHFPGGATIATGRFLTVELDDIEFDAAAARAYMVENLLPAKATPGDEAAPADELRGPAAPQADGNVIQFPYRTGLAGKPTSWNLIQAECRRRYAAGERQPTRAEWARVLINWLRTKHEGAPVPTQHTVTNRLAELMRELEAGDHPES